MAVAPGVIPPCAASLHVKIPADGLLDGKEQDNRQQGGDTQRPAHAGDVAFEIGCAAHFTIEGCAPVGPQVEEDQVGNHKENCRPSEPPLNGVIAPAFVPSVTVAS